MALCEVIQEKFNFEEFSLQDVYKAIPDKPKTTLRARIYDNLGIKFERLSKGVYKSITGNNQCILIEGNGRDLSNIKDNSIDCIITDHPWNDSKSNLGGDRKFTNEYSCFKYKQKDFNEKARVLKKGSFLVEIIPAENENNFDYLYSIKKMAQVAGFLYYAKVSWIKGNFVSNTCRKSKNTEEFMIFSSGKARSLRIDVKKTKALGEITYMSGSKGMLPTSFNVEPVPKKLKVHQAEKPVLLYEHIIEFLTLENEVILDQFAGSGNVGRAALNKNRSCILIELLKENVQRIKDRLGLKTFVS